MAVLSLIGVIGVMYNAPTMQNASCEGLGFAWMVRGAASDPTDTIATAWKCAKDYQLENPVYITGVYAALYMTMQAFAIPGTIVLSVLAGPLFGFVYGQVAIALCATTGSCVCFMISRFLGNGVLYAFNMRGKLAWYREQIDSHRSNLTAYMFLSRLTPVPNVLINVASPLVGVPLYAFAIGTMFGLMPMNAVHVTTGRALVTAAENPDTFRDIFRQNKKIGFLIFGCGTLLCIAMYLRGDQSAKKEKAAQGKDD